MRANHTFIPIIRYNSLYKLELYLDLQPFQRKDVLGISLPSGKKGIISSKPSLGAGENPAEITASQSKRKELISGSLVPLVTLPTLAGANTPPSGSG